MPFIACLNNVTNTHNPCNKHRHRTCKQRTETKPQKTTTNPQGQSPHEPATQTMQPSPTSKERKKSQITQKFELIRIALTTTQSRKCGPDCCRCSRPLCRSQTTTPPTPTHPTNGTSRRREDQKHQPQPNPRDEGRPADSSGPNSVLDPAPTNAGPR